MAGGRPLLFPNVEDLQSSIDGYFKYADDSKKPYTLASLACYLDTDTKTLKNYEEYNDGKFLPAIKKARQKIEASKAEKLESKDYNVVGLIFDLKNNHGYADKRELDNNINFSAADLVELAKNE